jgi:hypothetical protein
MNTSSSTASPLQEVTPLNEWSVGKDFCFRCSFYVKMDGHVERCRIKDLKDVTLISSSGEWSIIKLKAWIGDTMHRLDVQVISILLKIPDKDKDQFTQDKCNGKAQASWLSTYSNWTGTQTGHKSMSTQFESLYKELRSDYIDSLLLNSTVSLEDVNLYIASIY